MKDIQIRDLGVIGDRRTAALVTRDARVVWYCPGRFDRPSVFGALLDPQGGAWTVDVPHSHPSTRGYIGDTGILETQLETNQGSLVITDWLTMGDAAPAGALCRVFSPAPIETWVRLCLRPNYNREPVTLNRIGLGVATQGSITLYASHPIRIDVDAGEAAFVIPVRERGWAVLTNQTINQPDCETIEGWRAATISTWNELSKRVRYSGPYEREVAASLRALRLLTYEETGGIIAAATTSLPETLGGERNYDYRYVWTRDAGMIVSALSRAGSNGIDEGRFLDFICSAASNVDGMPMGPVAAVDCGVVPVESTLQGWAGYRNSRPVNIGNGARDQLQFDALGNVLLAAKLFYEQSGTRPHWPTVCEIADYLAEHWHELDFGIWEEREKRAYTAGKVITACGLEFIAECTQDRGQSERWQAAAREIRAYVAAHCLTAEGAYAAVADGQSVDVSAALFPIWSYTPADAPEMIATIAAIERNLADGGLYRRHLELEDSSTEGVFLAGTFWVAQYWIMRGATDRACDIIDAALRCANDLGLFAEEADLSTGDMLGNFPQSFVHAAFIGAVLDLKTATAKFGTPIRPV
ncbi:MAG: glycoside hydrolase family 15 protein [Acidobacteriota bacterium]|nr:glycoside hydrolase family 15 protein [Acidobacteriota bacterium]